MGLTRAKISYIDTAVVYFQDPLILLNNKSTLANTDVGFVFNRDAGISSNVALIWQESSQSFVFAYTSSNALPQGNVTIGSNANITAQAFIGSGAYLSTLPGYAYGNVNVAAYLNTQGYNLYSNVNVTAYLGTGTVGINNANVAGNLNIVGNLTVGNWITGGPSTGNISGVNFLTANNIVITTGGSISSLDGTVRIGVNANTAANAVSIGFNAGSRNQGLEAIAIGATAGNVNQGSDAVAIGFAAGQASQSANAVAIGYAAGSAAQGLGAIGVGFNAGQTSQSAYAVSIGYLAGQTSQSGIVAIGALTGTVNQGANAVAVGSSTGYYNQGANTVAVGYNAGYFLQGNNAVSLGAYAGYNFQGANSIAIGYSAGMFSMPANTIVITANNAIGLSPSSWGTYVDPIKPDATAGNILYYNTVSKEVTYGATATGTVTVYDNIAFDGVTTTYALRVNGIATSVANPYQLQVLVGGVAVQPTKNIYDYVNLTEINQFTRGYVLRNGTAANASYGSGNTIVFATPPAPGLQFVAQSTAFVSLPSFTFKQVTFTPINIALGQ